MNDYENKIVLNGGLFELDKSNDDATIIVKGDSIVDAINLHNNMSLKILLEPNSSLVFNMFDYAVNLSVNLDIEANDNSRFIINSSFISESDYSLNIDTKLYGDNIYGRVDVRGINEKTGVSKVTMNGTVAGLTKGCELNEYAKIINYGEKPNVMIPNLIVNTNEVVANHGVSIGTIDQNELFYLKTKGLDEITSKTLIEEGFLLSILPENVKEVVKNILVGR